MFSLPKAPLKDKMGRWLTKSLFKEFQYQAMEGIFPLFTLSDKDDGDIPSLYRLYMEASDIPEYTFAKTYLGSWEHWMRLCESSFFKPHISAWRKELEVKVRAEALNTIIQVAKDKSNKSSYDASKLLLKGEWKTTEEKKRGRPSKSEIEKEASRILAEDDLLKEDYSRLTN